MISVHCYWARWSGSVRRPMPSTNGNGNGGAKKDEENFDPTVLNDIATWLRSLRLHKYVEL